MDVDRVACFHDAVLGYSPMLYDLKQDSDFEKFKDALSKLWNAFDNDRKIPEKLVRFHPLHMNITNVISTIKPFPYTHFLVGVQMVGAALERSSFTCQTIL